MFWSEVTKTNYPKRIELNKRVDSLPDQIINTVLLRRTLFRKFSLIQEVTDWYLTDHMRLSRPILRALTQLSIFYLNFLVLSVKNYHYYCKRNIDLLGSEDLKSKFLDRYIPDLYKEHMIPSGRFPDYIIDAQQVIYMCGLSYHCEVSMV